MRNTILRDQAYAATTVLARACWGRLGQLGNKATTAGNCCNAPAVLFL